ncbi:MAG: prepilin-type N-terminal cleavage/methylation domain-containing protein [Deltaproteobacteria bacterium]|nr:prepilin-type N-terminal cleavage/methylation domain-containing protein [Deltaproteobacteria bacterium]
MAKKTGFTLIEVIMVMAVAAILFVAVAPSMLKGAGAVSALSFAKKLRSDMRYAQTLAMTRYKLNTPPSVNPEFRYRIRFNAADANCPYASQYTIVNDADGNGLWGENPNAAGAVESARDPSTGDDYFCVRLDSGNFSGFTISANFGGAEPGVLEFDTYGRPYNSDKTALASSVTVTITRGVESASILVTPNTGRVYTP